ncbi:unnamed protein product [Gemmata massiliana]|uniref:TIGR03067 domain-containing protein n=1 Tax=Gemmata massiliana TaxID=1210884 RepID=A0A6P2CUE4_9BACT|nr:TIGR03067 domain-containing protein [Gemmata massiliana]VTR92533.1 unnamed protein product [Gemmata massiliana]
MLASLLAVSLALAPGQPPKEDKKAPELSAEAKKELKKLEGKWQIVKALGSEGEADVKELDAFCAIAGTKLTFTRGTKTEVAEVTALDPGADPKCIDLTESRPGRPERVTEGVFKLDGDTLHLAMAAPKDGKLRPASVEKPTDGRIIVWVMKRVKE